MKSDHCKNAKLETERNIITREKTNKQEQRIENKNKFTKYALNQMDYSVCVHLCMEIPVYSVQMKLVCK